MSQIRRSPGASARATSTTTTVATTESNAATGQQLQRRRAAAQRLPYLDCGCADPWPQRCRHDQATDRNVDGYAAAVQLLDSLGYPAAPLLPELRALWGRGERRLVSSVTTRWVVA